jgi:chitodextrinase
MIAVRTNIIYTDLLETHSMLKIPYDSHGWTALGLLGTISTAMLNDIPEAETWFRTVVPTYINLNPNWGGEDGGWAMGTGYWSVGTLPSKEFMDALLAATGVNMYKKAYSRNEGLFPLYAWPHGSPTGVIGDANNEAPGPASVAALRRLAQMQQDPGLQWGASAIGSPIFDTLPAYYFGDGSLPATPPVGLPHARWFKDIGFVAMHSDLLNPDRVSAYFKSAEFGSYIHSHADQNSFVINAFGESLAVKAGYYDSHMTPHHAGYTWQTFSSNAITFDGRKGQPINNLEAKGEITGFVTSPDFDATSGDATAAYTGSLEQAVRHVLYLRPSMFVVVDQLKSANPEGSRFEWNLHAQNHLTLDDDHAGATITEGKASLKTRVHYPSNLEAKFEDRYLNLSGQEVRPGGTYAGVPNQKHAQFITPKSNAATIVSTMGVYRSGTAAPNVVSQNYDTYTKLTFEGDDTVVYVRLGDSGEVDAGAVRFDGAAAAVRGDSVLLVSGTKLAKDGVTLLTSDKPATIAYGHHELSVSGTDELNVNVHTAGITRVRDASGTDIPNTGSPDASVALRGVYWQATPAALALRVEKGSHTFKLNEAPSSQPLEDLTLEVYLGDTKHEVVLDARSDLNGERVAWGKLPNTEGLYQVTDAPTGFFFERHGESKAPYLEANAAIFVRGTDVRPLKLVKADSGPPAESQAFADFNRVRNILDVFAEAETFEDSGGGTFSRYNSRPYLSGGYGVTNWPTKGQWLNWTLNVPQSGTYDLVLMYVGGWDEGEQPTGRLAQLGDNAYFFTAPKTDSFGLEHSHWRALRVRTGTHLEPGPIKLTMWNSHASMNLDWIGLVRHKDDETSPTAPSGLELLSEATTSASIRWNASSDSSGIKEYRIYANNALKATVPGTLTESIVSGLTAGSSYRITVKAVDTENNQSVDSEPLTFTTSDSIVPEWANDAGLRTTNVNPDKTALSWSKATDNSGQQPVYNLYQANGSVLEKLATVTGTTFEVRGLQPNTSYRFKVEAVDLLGNETIDGPSVTVTTPASAINGGFYEPFTAIAEGPLASGNGWTVETRTADPNHNTSVTVTSSTNDSNKVLRLSDTYYVLTDEYRRTPGVGKSVPAISGRVTFETKYKFRPILGNPYGNYDIQLLNNNVEALRISGVSGGGIVYRTFENGTLVTKSFPSLTAGVFKIPIDQWMTLRVVLDTNTQTYDLTMMADALKTYMGPVDTGTLDKKNGIYQINGLPFSNPVSAITTATFGANRYTGEYELDDMSLVAMPEVTLAAPDRAGIGETIPVTVGVNGVTNAVNETVALRFDPGLFDFVGVNPAQAGVVVTNVSSDPANGTVSFQVGSSAPLNGTQNLAQLQLKSRAASGVGTVEVTSAQVKNGAGKTLTPGGLPGKTISVHTITGFEPVQVTTRVGEAPVLPPVVTAWFIDQTEETVPVVWAAVSPSQVAQPGVFKVAGSVTGTSIPAEAIVIVSAVPVTDITVNGENGASVVNQIGGTLRMTAFVAPNHATNKSVAWNVSAQDGSATGAATIDGSGLLTAVADGIVRVTASAVDGSKVTGMRDVTIDSTAPTITVTGLTYGSMLGNSGALSVQVDLSDHLTGVDSTKTTVALDSNPYVPGTSVLLYTLEPGPHTFTMTSTDLAGNTATVTLPFTIEVNIETLKQLVTIFTADGSIKQTGISNSLMKQLENGQLEAFINHVEAQSGKHIDEAAAAYLLRDARFILQ